MNTPNVTEQSQDVAAGCAPATGSETVLDEYVRLDKTIRDCEHALMIAERLNVRPCQITESEIEAVRTKLKETLIERAFLDELINRRGKSPNDPSSATAAGSGAGAQSKQSNET